MPSNDSPLVTRRSIEGHAAAFCGLKRLLGACLVVCLGLTACAGSASNADDVVSSPSAVVPLPTAQPLLPPLPTAAGVPDGTGASTPAAPPDAAAVESAGGPGLFDDETDAYASWQFNLAFERDLRTSFAVVENLFDTDGSLVAYDDALDGIQAYASTDSGLLARIDQIAADTASSGADAEVLALELVTRAFPDETRPVPAPLERPTEAELVQLVADGNGRLDPLKPTFFRLLHATVSLAAGQIAAPEGTPATLLVEELRAEAEAVYGPVLVEPLVELAGSIPAGAAFDSPEARRSFGQFAVALVDRVGRPALGE